MKTNIVKRMLAAVAAAVLLGGLAGCGSSVEVGDLGLGGSGGSSGKDKTEAVTDNAGATVAGNTDGSTQGGSTDNTATEATQEATPPETESVTEPATDAPVIMPTEEPTEKPTQAPAKFETELYDAGDFYLNIPKGWNVKIVYYYEKASPILDIYDPRNPDREMVVWFNHYLGAPTQSVKDTWLMIMQNFYGYSLDFNYLPVYPDNSAATILSRWEEQRDFLSSGDAVAELQKFTDFTVVDSAEIEDGWYVNYGNQWGFDVSESEAIADCKGPDGADCQAYMYGATAYIDAGGGWYDTNYYKACCCYTILVPDDYFAENINNLIACAKSIGFR